jgi:predicted nucleotidyltransferase
VRDHLPGATSRRRTLDRAERDLLIAQIRDTLDGARAVVFGHVFGSLITDTPIADVDVAVLLDAGKAPPPTHLDVQLELTGRLEDALHLPVDVVILNHAPLSLQLAAVRGRVAFSRDQTARQAFLERVSLQALDTAFLRRLALREVLSIT